MSPVRAAMSRYDSGTIVISQSERRLFLLLGDQAISYPVAVGRMGRQWRGVVHVDGKYRNPAWGATAGGGNGPSPGCRTISREDRRIIQWESAHSR